MRHCGRSIWRNCYASRHGRSDIGPELIGCAIVSLGLVPPWRLEFRDSVVAEKRCYPGSPFLWRFLTLAALAVWSLVTGAFSPFANVYLSRHLRMPLERIDIVFSFSHLVQVLAVLAAPLVFRKFGLVIGIVFTQIEKGPAKK
jgi:hypothetical protein